MAQHLSQVTGVSQVNVNGADKSAVRVQVDPARLAQLGISLEDVRLALTNATVNQPKGSLDGKDESFVIAVNDQLLDAKDFRSVVVTSRNGVPVRLDAE